MGFMCPFMSQDSPKAMKRMELDTYFITSITRDLGHYSSWFITSPT